MIQQQSVSCWIIRTVLQTDSAEMSTSRPPQHAALLQRLHTAVRSTATAAAQPLLHARTTFPVCRITVTMHRLA